MDFVTVPVDAEANDEDRGDPVNGVAESPERFAEHTRENFGLNDVTRDRTFIQHLRDLGGGISLPVAEWLEAG